MSRFYFCNVGPIFIFIHVHTRNSIRPAYSTFSSMALTHTMTSITTDQTHTTVTVTLYWLASFSYHLFIRFHTTYLLTYLPAHLLTCIKWNVFANNNYDMFHYLLLCILHIFYYCVRISANFSPACLRLLPPPPTHTSLILEWLIPLRHHRIRWRRPESVVQYRWTVNTWHLFLFSVFATCFSYYYYYYLRCSEISD